MAIVYADVDLILICQQSHYFCPVVCTYLPPLERRSGLSLHEILGIVGQSRLLDIHLTQEDGAPVAARPQAVAERDEAHMKSKVPPPAAVVPGVAAVSTAPVVSSTDDSRMQTQHPLPTAGVPGPTAAAASSHVPPSDKSHVKTDSPTPISEVPPAESTVEQSQNNLNPGSYDMSFSTVYNFLRSMEERREQHSVCICVDRCECSVQSSSIMYMMPHTCSVCHNVSPQFAPLPPFPPLLCVSTQYGRQAGTHTYVRPGQSTKW